MYRGVLHLDCEGGGIGDGEGGGGVGGGGDREGSRSSGGLDKGGGGERDGGGQGGQESSLIAVAEHVAFVECTQNSSSTSHGWQG